MVGIRVLSQGETDLLKGTPTQRSETGWILQPLKSLSMFIQRTKKAAATRDADELKRFTWENEDVQAQQLAASV